jgi:hypothetical protein
VDPSEPPVEPKSGGGARLIMVLGIALPLAFGAGVYTGIGPLAPKRAPAVMPSAAICAPPPVTSAAPPATPVELAASGDYKALDALKAKKPEERTAAETLALAVGKSGNKSRALEGFSHEIQKNPDVLKNKDELQRLRDFLADRETTNQAAAIIAALPGPLGPDLLYEPVAAAKGAHNETADLTEDLLAATDVRDKASPALKVALDLRGAKDCDADKALLVPAHDTGDRRAAPLLGKLLKKTGCGTSGFDDCFECLRDLDKAKVKDKDTVTLVDALRSSQKRAAPKY